MRPGSRNERSSCGGGPHVSERIGSKTRRRWLALTLSAVLATAGGCVGALDDPETAQRQMDRVRQEIAGISRRTQADREFLDSRLSKLEADAKGRSDSTARDSSASVADLNQRLAELTREMRFMQGKLEENSATVSDMQRRLDEAVTQLPA